MIIRTDLRFADLQSIIDLHGRVFAEEFRWNATLKAYVASPLFEFQRSPSFRSRIWLAEEGTNLVGCVAIVEVSPESAQLRWFIVEPKARKQGVGKQLLEDAVAFAKATGYSRVFLWTEQSLAAASRLYGAAGFVKTEEKPCWKWRAWVIEERWELSFGDSNSGPDPDSRP